MHIEQTTTTYIYRAAPSVHGYANNPFRPDQDTTTIDSVTDITPVHAEPTTGYGKIYLIFTADTQHLARYILDTRPQFKIVFSQIGVHVTESGRSMTSLWVDDILVATETFESAWEDAAQHEIRDIPF